MGTNETIAPSKAVKSSSVIPEQPSVHPYPDWGSMQAYYGHGVPIPTPYFGATVAPGHAYPYMWSPQPMLTPFGGAYTAIYPHGGVYSHPTASHMSSLVNPEVPAKPSTGKERSTAKKIEGIDGLAVSTGNHDAESAGCNENRSESEDNEAEGSSDGSDGNSESGGSEKPRNRSSDDIRNSGGATTDAHPTISLGMTAAPGAVTPIPLANLTPGMDLRSSNVGKLKPGGGVILSTTAINERVLKREKRKQSNRESARRSRLRKQAETEELAIKVGNLNAENTTLRSEITRLIESSDKIRMENSILMEKLKKSEVRHEDEIYTEEEAPSIVIENLLSRMDNSSKKMEDEPCQNSNGKLNQLLEEAPRTDAVAAS